MVLDLVLKENTGAVNVTKYKHIKKNVYALGSDET